MNRLKQLNENKLDAIKSLSVKRPILLRSVSHKHVFVAGTLEESRSSSWMKMSVPVPLVMSREEAEILLSDNFPVLLQNKTMPEAFCVGTTDSSHILWSGGVNTRIPIAWEEVYTNKTTGIEKRLNELDKVAKEAAMSKICPEPPKQPEPSSALDIQVGGDHYKGMGVQPLEFTYRNYGYEGLKATVHTKINKYIGRTKDDEVEQLKKARHCLDILIEKAELERN